MSAHKVSPYVTIEITDREVVYQHNDKDGHNTNNVSVEWPSCSARKGNQ